MPDLNEDYWSENDDPYINPSTKILKNLADLKTREQLDTYESLVFQVNFPEALERAFTSDINFDLWKEIHRICFKDVYGWAGVIRTIRMSKGQSVFAYPEYIETEARKIFNRYNKLHASNNISLETIADVIGELNVIHPFREGNGRTLRIILEAVCDKAGYTIDYDLTNQEEQTAAFIKSYHGDNSELSALLFKITNAK